MRNQFYHNRTFHTQAYIFFILVFLFCQSRSFSQTYTMPTVGIQSTYVGTCPDNTCSGTFYDNGGSGANYSANINAIARTFTPSTAGRCLRATFTSFSMNDTYFLCLGPSDCCDYLTIYNGPDFSSPVLYNNCASSPGTITSTSPSGSLTFRFTSDGSVQLAGWAATLSCVPCAGGPAANSSSDCDYAIPIYGNGTFTNATKGSGLVAEACAGCTIGETYSNWYGFTAATSGTLGFTIDPIVNTEDFDFAVFGPNITCGALGTPIRCSKAAASGTGNTGLGGGRC